MLHASHTRATYRKVDTTLTILTPSNQDFEASIQFSGSDRFDRWAGAVAPQWPRPGVNLGLVEDSWSSGDRSLVLCKGLYNPSIEAMSEVPWAAPPRKRLQSPFLALHASVPSHIRLWDQLLPASFLIGEVFWPLSCHCAA